MRIANRDELDEIANGYGFSLNGPERTGDVSPEAFLIESISFFGDSLIKRELRFFSLLRTWVRLHASFLRPDAILKMSSGLNETNQSILGSLVAIAQESDNRESWVRLVSRLETISYRNRIFIAPKNFPRKGLDVYLLRFNISMRRMEFQQERKFRDREWLIINNPWFRNRYLIGVGARADLLTCSQYLPDMNENIAKHMIGISRSSYYELKKENELLKRAIHASS